MQAGIFAIIATMCVMVLDTITLTTPNGAQWISLFLLFLISFKQD